MSRLAVSVCVCLAGSALIPLAASPLSGWIHVGTFTYSQSTSLDGTHMDWLWLVTNEGPGSFGSIEITVKVADLLGKPYTLGQTISEGSTVKFAPPVPNSLQSSTLSPLVVSNHIPVMEAAYDRMINALHDFESTLAEELKQKIIDELDDVVKDLIGWKTLLRLAGPIGVVANGVAAGEEVLGFIESAHTVAVDAGVLSVYVTQFLQENQTHEALAKKTFILSSLTVSGEYFLEEDPEFLLNASGPGNYSIDVYVPEPSMTFPVGIALLGFSAAALRRRP